MQITAAGSCCVEGKAKQAPHALLSGLTNHKVLGLRTKHLVKDAFFFFFKDEETEVLLY